MQKIVINVRYGGYGLSAFALLKLYEQGSDSVEACDPEEYYGKGDGWEEQFERDKSQGWCVVAVAPDGQIITTNDDCEVRSDPALVKLVEQYGNATNGEFAELKVVKIPDDVDYWIKESNGVEWVSEKHRTWR